MNESKLNLNNNGITFFAENFSGFLINLNWRHQWKTNLKNTSLSLDLEKKVIAVKLRIKDQLNLPKLRIQRKSLKIWGINIDNNTDILIISKRKLDPSFPNREFHIHGFSESYRFDRNGIGGGILLYIREDIPSELILTKMTIEGSFVEINLRKKSGSFAAHMTRKFLWYQEIWTKLVKTLIYCYLNLIILCW